jgi:mono/diheme cytochrome c family protein
MSPKTVLIHFSTAALALMLASIISPAEAQTQTARDGVYTDAQAAAGKVQYEASCGSCHAADLTGGRGGPLKGDAFMANWGEDNLDTLFTRIKTSMPRDAPASLTDDAYVEIIAYVLQANAFPSGGSTLKSDMLKNIRIEVQSGPQPVPNFALVQVIGCLTHGGGNTWEIANGTEPVRTRDPGASKDDELKSAQAKVLGTQTFELLSIYPSPDPYKGHRVEAKGFLIRGSKESKDLKDRINVTSIQTLAPGCER